MTINCSSNTDFIELCWRAVGGSGLAAVAGVRGPSGLGLPLMAGPAVGVLSVGARGFRRRGGHENFHPPVLGGGSPPCLLSSERG
ncbi:hypothetical protein PBY51_007750 [Eleginops maclovinus]|uniref:Uncharacterized protein n=1 Tax=Eleginops maclovinus TaxID=56733 RepID=A0AAN7X7Z1_ELEMC|nr:hypothetical protein PBY51_007750 [Eleginops maclovinus]